MSKSITKKLLESAKKFNNIAAWEWLSSYDIFGIKLPNYEQVFYCVVLGAEGLEYGLVVNNGVDGLKSYIDLFYSDGHEELKYEQNAYGIYFNDRDELQKEDYSLIKETEIGFRGKKKWPSFRKYVPGYLGAIPNQEEQQLLQQILEIAAILTVELKKYDTTQTLLEQDLCLIRSYENDSEFKDEYMSFETIMENHQKVLNVPVAYDEFSIRRIANQSQVIDTIWEVDTVYYPYAVEENGIAFFPNNLLIVDINSRLIVGQHLSSPVKIAESFQKYLLAHFDKEKELPKHIVIANHDLYFYLKDMLEILGVDVIFVDELQLMPYVKEDFTEMFKKTNMY